MEYYVEKNSWGLLKTWWLQKTCLRSLQLKSPGNRMSSGKKRAQHLASGKADMNDQVREDKDGLTRRRGEAREAGSDPRVGFYGCLLYGRSTPSSSYVLSYLSLTFIR